jgi:4-hydroxybenzoate polyprenyltransferase
MKPRDIVALMRPRQWTKNLAVFAAVIFSANLLQPRLVGVVTLAFVSLCLVASGVYAANDALDADRDRQHPVKRERPVASGRVAVAQALWISAVLVASGVALAAMLGTGFLIAVGAYLLVQVLYEMWLKNVAIVDLLAIAAGFVIRAVSGAFVISVVVSPWLVVCTGLLALFLAAAKRRHELVLLQGHSSAHRPVLSEYSAELLDSFMVTLSAATITSYALYTFFETRTPNHLMMLTIPFVIYGVLRYQFLVLSREGGGRPEEVLLGDRPMIVCVGLWIASAVLALYAAPILVG